MNVIIRGGLILMTGWEGNLILIVLFTLKTTPVLDHKIYCHPNLSSTKWDFPPEWDLNKIKEKVNPISVSAMSFRC